MDFQYSVEKNLQEVQKNDSYYILSDELFMNGTSFDANGILYYEYGGMVSSQGSQYNPAYIAWYGLICINQFFLSGNKQKLKIAENYAQWLVDNYDYNERAWVYPFDKYEGTCLLKSPWKSAMSQGLAISLLTRIGKICSRDDCFDLAEKAFKVFQLSIEDGGVQTEFNGSCYFEEYPAYPNTYVLDGFCFSLLGLYDLWKYTKNEEAKRLFDKGVYCLSENLNHWNYRNKWTWYGSHHYLCNSQYNKLNYCLVSIIGKLSNRKELLEKSRGWNPIKLSTASKLEIKCMYSFTYWIAVVRIIILKNLKRIKKNVWYSWNIFK